MIKYTPAFFEGSAFNCPLCNAYAKQHWRNFYSEQSGVTKFSPFYRRLFASWCEHCQGSTLWFDGRMLIPESGNAPLPHPEMPADVANDYEEARGILARSPRSAAALLRLAIQKLCVELGQPGKNINDDISALVKKGLPELVQQALDIVRVVGNEQVHPGELDVRDDPQIASQLFELVNLIVEDRIARPKQIQELYLKLPQSKRDAIEKRDA